jgi:hypothetical protein
MTPAVAVRPAAPRVVIVPSFFVFAFYVRSIEQARWSAALLAARQSHQLGSALAWGTPASAALHEVSRRWISSMCPTMIGSVMTGSKASEFSKATKRRLAERAAFLCSRPDCRERTIAPGTNDDEEVHEYGDAAHVARSQGRLVTTRPRPPSSAPRFPTEFGWQGSD